ncbi:MAG: hypothetical protein HY816_20140 [Candidatus Wallbacteria bacterium]|nr:hypothetical protein [Candidatus Wallbacteria bacterium]
MTRKPLSPTYKNADEAQKMADRIICEHYTDLAKYHVAVRFVFTRKQSTSSGRILLGRAAKQNELQRFIRRQADPEAEPVDAVVVLNAVEWGVLRPETREALVDHQLCRLELVCSQETGEPRLEPDGRPKLRVRSPDIQEFREVLHRRGFWSEELEDAKGAIEKASAELPGQAFLPGVEREGESQRTVGDLAADVRLLPFEHLEKIVKTLTMELGNRRQARDAGLEGVFQAQAEAMRTEGSKIIGEPSDKAKELLKDPKIARAVRDLVRPKDGTYLESMSINGKDVYTSPQSIVDEAKRQQDAIDKRRKVAKS